MRIWRLHSSYLRILTVIQFHIRICTRKKFFVQNVKMINSIGNVTLKAVMRLEMVLDKEALRNLRLFKRYTLKEVGKSLGISAAQLSRYERGRSHISAEFLLRLLSFYGDSIQQVVDTTESSHKSS